MTGPEAPHARAAYVTVYTRMAEIRELRGREPTANELRALDELPLETNTTFYLHDDSENGKRIYELLRQSEKNRDVSLLEEAGELLWQQSMKLPPHWQSPSSPSLPLNEVPDDAYQFSPMSNDPFAKAGSVKPVERAVPQKLPATKFLESSPTKNHLKEPEHCDYPELLVNPPERWIKNSPACLQPMPLIQPVAFTYSDSWPKQQMQRQISASGSKTPNPTKISDTYRVLKLTAGPKSKAKAQKKQTPYLVQQTGGSQGFQSLQQQPALAINPNLLVPSWQQYYLAVPPAATGLQPTVNTYKSMHSTNANQLPTLPQVGATHHAAGLATISRSSFSLQNQFPTPSAPVIESATYSTTGHNPNPQSYHPAANRPVFSQPPAIRTPTALVASTQQGQFDMPWLSLTSGSYKSVTTAAQAIGTQSYDEVYRIAKETADNLAKVLGNK